MSHLVSTIRPLWTSNPGHNALLLLSLFPVVLTGALIGVFLIEDKIAPDPLTADIWLELDGSLIAAFIRNRSWGRTARHSVAVCWGLFVSLLLWSILMVLWYLAMRLILK